LVANLVSTGWKLGGHAYPKPAFDIHAKMKDKALYDHPVYEGMPA